MKRSRIALLSSCAILASGALVFACSGSSDDNDGGNTPDAKADTTSNKDSTTNDSATKDSQTTNDASDASEPSDASDASDASASDGEVGDGGIATTFMVLRVGGADDAGADAALNNASTQAFLEERNISDGSLVRTIDLPIAANGQNQPVTISGSATSEGSITTSADGKLVVFVGYASAPGVTGIASTTVFDGGTLRVVGRVDHSGAIDTTTRLLAFDQNNIRGAASNDGTEFWAVGTLAGDAGDQYGGVQYVLLSSTGATTNITEVPYNTRAAGIFGGQLFVGSQLTPNDGVSSVGTGLPTTTGQTATLLPGFIGDAGSPYGFSMLDVDASITGLDTLYLADDSSQAKGGGIQKWVSNGSTWTKITTFTNGTTVGFRGLTAMATSSGVIVLGTTDETSGNTVVEYLDDGSTLTPTGTVIATALTNTAYRGIAIAPQ